MYQNNIIHRVSKIIVDIMFYGGIICLIAIPFLIKYINKFYGYNEYTLNPMPFILIISGILAIYILYNLKRMYRTLLSGNPFISENVSHFRKMALACMLISIIYALKCVFMFTVTTVILVLVFAIGCLFCLTLKDLFKQAVKFKEENDLTI